MTVTLTINNTSYEYPETGDENWGEDATLWAGAVSTELLQKSGGNFTLSGEVDFGAAFGLKSICYKSRAAIPSLSGVFRMGNAEAIGWRDSGDTADYLLQPGSADGLLSYGGGDLVDLTTPQTILAKTLTSVAAIQMAGDINVAGAGDKTFYGSLGAFTLTLAGASSTVSIPGTALAASLIMSGDIDVAVPASKVLYNGLGANTLVLAGVSSTVDVPGTLSAATLSVPNIGYEFEDNSGDWDGVATSKTYDVSGGNVTDARKMIWTFQDAANDRRILKGADISFPSATQVTVSWDLPIDAGTYWLVGSGGA